MREVENTYAHMDGESKDRFGRSDRVGRGAEFLEGQNSEEGVPPRRTSLKSVCDAGEIRLMLLIDIVDLNLLDIGQGCTQISGR